jgi:uncharacterized phage-associated protein
MKKNEVSALDVAAYILQHAGEMTTMKLQKLVYYCQAWGLVWDEAPLFKEPIEAWVNGPIVRELYESHRGFFSVDATKITADPSKLDANQKDTVDNVLKYYGGKSSKYLVDLTHEEDPWKLARERAGLSTMERGDAEITHADMAEYYSSL